MRNEYDANRALASRPVRDAMMRSRSAMETARERRTVADWLESALMFLAFGACLLFGAFGLIASALALIK